MKISRLVVLITLLIIAVSWFGFSFTGKHLKINDTSGSSGFGRSAKLHYEKLQLKASFAKKFVQQKAYNDKTCFLVDMSLPSGQNRFFIYDFKKDTVSAAGLVAHGNCFQYWLEGRKYSNVVGCGCTSLGKYRIGSRYTGKFGYSYKLHGLDTTNNNAFERTVVLHAHTCVPETEVTEEICQSNGCPTVSPLFLEQLKKIINTSAKPVLLWIYE